MLGYNRTITRTNIKVLLNIGPRAGEEGKKELKSSSLPNTFDDDCSVDLVNYDSGQNPFNSKFSLTFKQNLI